MRQAALWIAILLLLSLRGGPAFAYADHLESQEGEQWTQVGKASYYSSRLHGRRTASGEPYDETALTDLNVVVDTVPTRMAFDGDGNLVLEDRAK